MAKKRYDILRRTNEHKNLGKVIGKIGAKGVTYADQQDDRKGGDKKGSAPQTAEERKKEAELKKR